MLFGIRKMSILIKAKTLSSIHGPHADLLGTPVLSKMDEFSKKNPEWHLTHTHTFGQLPFGDMSNPHTQDLSLGIDGSNAGTIL